MTEDDGPTTGARSVTLKDVARLAGVSTATASKAMNGRDRVGAQTRSRVLEAAEQLRFTPNALARAMHAGRSGTVGLLAHDLDGRFSLPILMGAEDAFGVGETSVLLCDAREDSIRERHHLRALLSRRVDGLIVVGKTTNPRPPLPEDVPVPVVYAYAPSERPGDPAVVPDNVQAGRLAVAHLLASGRRRVAHVSGVQDYLAATDRARGARDALADAGLELLGPVRYGAWTEEWGRAGARAVLDQHPDVDAVLCASDQIARGALEALREGGVRVPEDVAVMGFDDWAPMVLGSRPELTSVDMDFEGIGRRAAQLLEDAMAGRPARGTLLVEPRVVVRGSTGPPA
ncbi:LacI family DNA-binding transcriptional regulator [Pseudokineococcus sp. 5B2Z-1]|uniref:LacI family DNA-binding transcriptional regulator n=1 Tax=Pseudokineococcus sp. 5B2Z-1 TaxID=3132744 RepID=UPI00309F5FD2